MFLAQLASVSPDVPIFGLSLLACTLLAREVCRDEARERVVFLIAGLIALAAAVRPPMIGLLLPVAAAIWFRGAGTRLRRAASGTAVLVVALGAVLTWTAFAMRGLVDTRMPAYADVSAMRQLSFLADRPDRALVLINTTLTTHWQVYFEGMIGLLGWLDTPLEDWFYNFSATFIVMLALLSISDEAQPPGWFTLMVVIGVISSAGLIFAALYLGWTPVGAPVVEGVQGRYFLPLLAALVLVCPRVLGNAPMLRRQGIAPTLLAIYALVALGHVTWILVRRYYLT
jgi:uncharacterized membrane protein